MGTMSGPRTTSTTLEKRPGSAGALRTSGGSGAMSGPRTTSTTLEKRHGSAGALRTSGGLGAISGPPMSLVSAQGTAEQAAGEGAGVLAVLQEDLAVHDGRRDAAAALDEALGSGRKVVDDLRQLGRDRVGIEDDQVRGQALANQATIGEAPLRRRHERQHPHGVLERERLPLAHPVREQVRLE